MCYYVSFMLSIILLIAYFWANIQIFDLFQHISSIELFECICLKHLINLPHL